MAAFAVLLSVSPVTYDLLRSLLTPPRGEASILDPRLYPTAATRAVAVGAVVLVGVATSRVVREGRRFAIAASGTAILLVGMAGVAIRQLHLPPDLAARSVLTTAGGLSLIAVGVVAARRRARRRGRGTTAVTP